MASNQGGNKGGSQQSGGNQGGGSQGGGGKGGSQQSGTSNRGLMLRLAGGSPSAHYRVYLAEAPDPALRPKLTVVYR